MLVELPFIWKGTLDLAGWGGNLMVFDWNPSLWKKFILREGAVNKPGVMTFYLKANDEEQHFLKLTYGDWSTPWTNAAADPAFDAGAGAVAIDPSAANYKIEVTQADIDQVTTGGMVIYGTGLTITAIKYEPGKTLGGGHEHGPSNDPVEIWSGNVDLAWGAGGRVCIPAEAFETAKAGSLLRFTINCKVDTWCQAQVNDGAWAND